ncbi:MAG TPA: ATP synthase F1 subunit gamma [Solirubrobacteraceae bacterium]|jgi:F-type H+-transporting ATPase subunit gamma|nr:ATP synthase F1 subunit gamma [Solirubrobacteraceae bacterium]
MADSQRDVRSKIASVKNIQKITGALETVAAARLRRAEQRISALRPYANAIRRMTRQAAQAAGSAEAARVPLLGEHESERNVAVLLVTGDRGLAGAFNSQIIRAGVREAGELSAAGLGSSWYATGRRGVSSLGFRGFELAGSYVGFSDRPAYADARTIAGDLITAYVDGHVDRVEMIYNAYVSPLRQTVTHERLLPLTQATIAGEDEDAQDEEQPRVRASVDYEPDPEAILRRLLPDYVEISIYRALVESTAGFFGAQMTAMRSASDNAREIITELTLQMNRARQAEITQEILEVVAGAEGLS